MSDLGRRGGGSRAYDHASVPIRSSKTEPAPDPCLGLLFDANLTFKGHVQFVVSKEFKVLYSIKRKSGLLRNVQTLLTLYNTLVKPVSLMYCPSGGRGFK